MEMGKITLLGSSDVENRIDLLRALFDQSDGSLKHVADWRQRNMNVALIIFLGLLGFGIQQDELVYQLSSSISVFIIMSVFAFWDRKLHKSSHVLHATRDTFGILMSQVINNPDQDISYHRYRSDCEKDAEWFSFQPIIYYLLILSGLVSFFAFLFL